VKPGRGGRIDADVGVVDELPEGLGDDGAEQALMSQGHEEAQILGPRLEVIAQLGITVERLHSAGLQGNQSGLAELGLANQQHTVGPVDVAAVELDGLADP
jgi:hypothetical protein